MESDQSKQGSTDLQADHTATSWPREQQNEPTSCHGKLGDKNTVLAHNWNYADASQHTQVVSKLQWIYQDNT